MPSIAFFYSKFTKEKEILKRLSAELDLPVVTDDNIVADACAGNYSTEKLKRALYGKTSLFNDFTLERERHAAQLKKAMAGRLAQKKDAIYYGFSSLLIPATVSHVLRVCVVDTKENRVRRVASKLVSEKKAGKMVRQEDVSAFAWSDFLFGKVAYDPSLYDILIPLEGQEPEAIVEIIKKHLTTSSLIETSESIHAVADLELAAEIELAMATKGQKVGVAAHCGRVTLTVNQDAFSYSSMVGKLSEIAESVPGVKGVEVVRGQEATPHVYRDHNFVLPPKVLLVDDEKDYVLTLSERLESRNVGPRAVFDGEEALHFIDEETPDVMVLDLKMPGINGIEVLQQTKRRNPNIEIIILTGHGSERERETCLSLGAFAYLEKPTDVEDLSKVINEAYEKIKAA